MLLFKYVSLSVMLEPLREGYSVRLVDSRVEEGRLLLGGEGRVTEADGIE